MQKRKLGKEGLTVSCIGLGCMGMSQSYGTEEDRNDADSIKVIHRALEIGVNFFDTAEIYGPFKNEELLGKALKGRRDQAIIATKFGFKIEGNPPYAVNSSPNCIKTAVEGSLKRLGVDTIDLLYQHRVDPKVPIEEVVGAMSELIKQGKVRFLGLSEAGLETIKKAHRVHKISALQSEYSLWERGIEESILPALRELGIGLVPFSPLGRGFLTGSIKSYEDIASGDYRKTDPRYQGENFSKNMDLVNEVTRIADIHGATPAQVALAWLLQQGEDIVPIPGTKRLSLLEENMYAFRLQLSTSEIADLNELAQKTAGDRYQPHQMAQVER